MELVNTKTRSLWKNGYWKLVKLQHCSLNAVKGHARLLWSAKHWRMKFRSWIPLVWPLQTWRTVWYFSNTLNEGFLHELLSGGYPIFANGECRRSLASLKECSAFKKRKMTKLHCCWNQWRSEKITLKTSKIREDDDGLQSFLNHSDSPWIQAVSSTLIAENGRPFNWIAFLCYEITIHEQWFQ